MMVKAATDKNKSELVCTVAAGVSKMVQSPSENDKARAEDGDDAYQYISQKRISDEPLTT
jgi:hypothetical protein